MEPAQFRVLMVEDSKADVRLFQLQCADRFPLLLEYAMDGEQALTLLLQRTVPYDLVLLDLNLPRVHGFDVLRNIRSSPVHRHSPVVVLTSSGSAQDVVQAYELGASCFIQKPIDLEQYTNALSCLMQFWTQVVVLPRWSAA